jgi:hypothetical protein
MTSSPIIAGEHRRYLLERRRKYGTTTKGAGNTVERLFIQ